MIESLEDLKAIRDGAPDDGTATHVDEDEEYVKFIGAEMYHHPSTKVGEWASDYHFPLELRSLSDINRIIELLECNE